MYNIFYIYTYKYKTVKHVHALTHSRPKCQRKPRTYNSLISYTHPQAQNASHLYMSKMHKPHNVPSHMVKQLAHMWRF